MKAFYFFFAFLFLSFLFLFISYSPITFYSFFCLKFFTLKKKISLIKINNNKKKLLYGLAYYVNRPDLLSVVETQAGLNPVFEEKQAENGQGK